MDADSKCQFLSLSTSLFAPIQGIIARSWAPGFSIGCAAAAVRLQRAWRLSAARRRAYPWRRGAGGADAAEAVSYSHLPLPTSDLV